MRVRVRVGVRVRVRVGIVEGARPLTLTLTLTLPLTPTLTQTLTLTLTLTLPLNPNPNPNSSGGDVQGELVMFDRYYHPHRSSPSSRHAVLTPPPGAGLPHLHALPVGQDLSVRSGPRRRPCLPATNRIHGHTLRHPADGDGKVLPTALIRQLPDTDGPPRLLQRMAGHVHSGRLCLQVLFCGGHGGRDGAHLP